MKINWIHTFLVLCCFGIMSCSKDDDSGNTAAVNKYVPTPLELDVPPLFKQKLIAPVIPFNNLQTVEGTALGKKLFYDPILSGDNSLACASCHAPENAFTDRARFSAGIDGNLGIRNSMPLFNLAWNFDERFAWDGKELSLERQALEPVQNALEMHADWDEVVEKLKGTPDYPELFNKAFGDDTVITKELVTRALAQFERTLISANSKFDRFQLGEVALTPEEQNGFNVFMDEERGDCFHCHGSDSNPLWTDNIFHNNGLDLTFNDLGLGGVNGDPIDYGKFKSPSIRNLVYTAPYMHDGRFNTLEEVINHYSEGLKPSPTIDPLMKKVSEGGVGLSAQDKADLKAFLLTLSDPSFLTNPAYINN